MNALIYAPSGGGKTCCSTMVRASNRGRNLLLCSDNSHIVLNNEQFHRDNLDIEVIEHWLDRNKEGKEQSCFSKQFESAIDSKKYDTIIIDNISDLFDLAVLECDDVGKERDPRRYYQMIYQSLKRLARKAAQVDCNVIFTAWTDIQEVPMSDGSKLLRTQPKLPNKILDNFLGLTQIVGYVTTAMDGDTKRWFYILSGSPTLYAKDQLYCRKSCLPEDIFIKEDK